MRAVGQAAQTATERGRKVVPPQRRNTGVFSSFLDPLPRSYSARERRAALRIAGGRRSGRRADLSPRCGRPEGRRRADANRPPRARSRSASSSASSDLAPSAVSVTQRQAANVAVITRPMTRGRLSLRRACRRAPGASGRPRPAASATAAATTRRAASAASAAARTRRLPTITPSAPAAAAAAACSGVAMPKPTATGTVGAGLGPRRRRPRASRRAPRARRSCRSRETV